VRARFAARAGLLHGSNLDAAIVAVEHGRRDEQRAFAIASAFGRGSRPPLAVLDELRLLLRWLRFKRALCDGARSAQQHADPGGGRVSADCSTGDTREKAHGAKASENRACRWASVDVQSAIASF
jgi:hypothetical protein